MIQGGLLVTCEHNLSYQTKEKRHEFDECLVYRVGENQGVYEAQVIIRNKNLDLAVLRIKDAPDGLEHFTLEVTKEPNIGDRIAVLGFPNHKTGVHVGVLKCRITNKYPLYEVQHSEVDKTLYAGNSGGPVINSSYHVVGVAAKGAEGNPNGKNTFIRISVLIEYLQRSGFEM